MKMWCHDRRGASDRTQYQVYRVMYCESSDGLLEGSTSCVLEVKIRLAVLKWSYEISIRSRDSSSTLLIYHSG